jgi:hypothetical protein
MVPLRTFLDRQRRRREANAATLPVSSLCSGAALTLLLAVSSSQHVWADEPATDAEAANPTAADEQNVLDQAEAAVATATADAADKVARDTAADLAEAPPSEEKASLIRQVAGILSGDRNFSDARGVALSDDSADQTEKARTLVLIAKAERASGQPAQAWFTLHEAQQIALSISDPESIVGVFREIGAVEQDLTRDAAKQGRSTFGTLDPKSGQVIGAVLDYGLPPQGYHEIEVLRAGGGPLREPTIVRHQYFYNGDRYFQGPNLRGGQTIIQAVHPVTQCLTQCRITVPAGAPIVTYTEHQIRYLYPKVAVVLDFRKDGDVDLNYRQARNPYTRLKNKLAGGSSTGLPTLPASGTASSLGKALQIGVGNPLELSTRLPVISDLLNRDTRIPGTLTQPQ